MYDFYNLGLSHSIYTQDRFRHTLGLHGGYSDGTKDYSLIRKSLAMTSGFDYQLGAGVWLLARLDLIEQEWVKTPRHTNNDIAYHRLQKKQHWFLSGGLGLVRFISFT